MLAMSINDQFRGELNVGERLIWSGQPHQGLLLRPADALMIPFSLLWGGFAVFWETTVLWAGAPTFFALWGIPFVLAGLYFIFGRFLVDIYQRKRIYYALTNERAIIISGMFTRNIKSLDLGKLPEINVSTTRDGKGTITFGTSHPMGWFYSVGGWPNTGRYHVAPSFEMIGDVNSVYRSIKDVQRERSIPVASKAG